MASRSTNTMQEALQKMMRDIADMKTLPDADIPFLVTIENQVLQRMKQPVEALVQQGQLPAGDPMAQGMPSMMGAAPGSMQSGGLMAGGMAPSSDELSRLLGSGAPGL